MRNNIIPIISYSILTLIVVVLILFLALYFWPRTVPALQKADVKNLTYDEAITKAHDKQKHDTLRPHFDSRCGTRLLTHGKKTSKAVIMMHGITACPEQYDSLAKTFFDAGYNVYIPLAPHHGTSDKKAHGNMTLAEISDYMNDTLTIGTNLGDTVGIVGISGGGVLGTWMAQHSDAISRLLVQSPFYEPPASAAPKWQLPLLESLYGYNLLQDSFTRDFSLRTLAKYLIVKDNFNLQTAAPSLEYIATVTSPNDDNIDLTLAHTLPKQIATTSKANFREHTLPKDLGIGHDIVGPYSKEVTSNQAYLDKLYLALYENTELPPLHQ